MKITAFLTVVLIFAPATFYYGQSSAHGCARWTSPDRSFSVCIPVSPEEQQDEFNDESGKSYKSVKTFGGREADLAFLIVVLELSEMEKRHNTREKFTGLQFLVGGDSDHDFSESYSKVGGFPVKQIIYANQNNRGLLVDTGDKVFILALQSKQRKDLRSLLANQFFSSFKLAR